MLTPYPLLRRALALDTTVGGSRTNPANAIVV
jgi:hypothetical protein